jgi:hypothetical protein
VYFGDEEEDADEKKDDATRPMARLVPSIGALTSLTRLTLDSDYDFLPDCPFNGWKSAADRLLRPLAPSLRRVEISAAVGDDEEGDVCLPDAFSLLTSLSSLEVRAYNSALYADTALRGLAKVNCLRRLELDADGRYEHWGSESRDLAALLGRSKRQRLQHLRVWDADERDASFLEHRLPKLRSLVLSYPEAQDWEFELPSRLYKALKRRIRRAERRNRPFEVSFGTEVGDTSTLPWYEQRRCQPGICADSSGSEDSDWVSADDVEW